MKYRIRQDTNKRYYVEYLAETIECGLDWRIVNIGGTFFKQKIYHDTYGYAKYAAQVHYNSFPVGDTLIEEFTIETKK